jgi:outer membrane protein TolC
MITIVEVNRILNEGTAEEVAQLQAQISTIETQLQRVSQPLITRKNRLTAMLAQKQKQLSNQPAAPTPAQPAPASPTQATQPQ